MATATGSGPGSSPTTESGNANSHLRPAHRPVLYTICGVTVHPGMATSSNLRIFALTLIRPALAAVIRAVRGSLGLTQEGLSHATSRTYVAKIENAQSTPTLDKFSELAEALGLSPLALLSLVLATRDNVSTQSLLAQATAELEALEQRISASDIAEHLTGVGVLKRPAARPVNVVKLKKVLQCKESGLSQSETARQLGITRSTVNFLWKRSLPADD